MVEAKSIEVCKFTIDVSTCVNTADCGDINYHMYMCTHGMFSTYMYMHVHVSLTVDGHWAALATAPLVLLGTPFD